MRIKYIDLNLWMGGIFFDKIVDFLLKEKPDILAVQEAYNGHGNFDNRFQSIDKLKELGGLPYFSFAPAFLHRLDNGKQIEQGNAILSRFPILKEEHFFYDVPYGELPFLRDVKFFPTVPRNLQWTQIKVNKTILNVFNTQGIWGADGLDSERRFRMVEQIEAKIVGKKNVVLSGDFNLREDTKAAGGIEKYLKNIFKGRLTSTFNTDIKAESKIFTEIKGYPKDMSGFKKSVVDMIFVSHDIAVESCQCPQVAISDHLPLIANLILTEN